MSGQETKSEGEMGAPLEAPVTAVSKLDEAVRAIEEARLLNKKQQNGARPGTAIWHLCEAIDDKLYNALAALGQ
jgi:hypothetical protein